MDDREELLKAFETLQVSVAALKAEKTELQKELDILKDAEKNDEIRRVSETTINDTNCDSENPTDSKVEQSHLKMDHEAAKAEKDEDIKKSVVEYSDLKNNLTSKDVDPMDLQECLVNPAVDGLASIDETSCTHGEDTQLLKTLRAENASLADAVKTLNREKADMHQFHSQVSHFFMILSSLWNGKYPLKVICYHTDTDKGAREPEK